MGIDATFDASALVAVIALVISVIFPLIAFIYSLCTTKVDVQLEYDEELLQCAEVFTLRCIVTPRSVTKGFQWYKNRVAIPGAFRETYDVRYDAKRHGLYHCEVRGRFWLLPCRTYNKPTRKLPIRAAEILTVTIIPLPRLEYKVEENIFMQCTVRSPGIVSFTPRFRYTWYHNHNIINQCEMNERTMELKLIKLDFNHFGTYYCQVSLLKDGVPLYTKDSNSIPLLITTT